VLLLLEERERTLFGRDVGRRIVGGVTDRRVDLLDDVQRLRRAVAHAHLDQRVAESHRAEPGPARAELGVGVFLDEVEVRVDDVVEEAHGYAGVLAQGGVVHLAVLDERGQVERPEVAHAPRWQPLLAAWVHAADVLVVPGVRFLVVPVHEDDAGLGAAPSRGADEVPQVAGLQRLLDLALPLEFPVAVAPHRVHERIGHADRQVGVVDPAQVLLDGDELFDVRVVVVEHQHQRAAPAAALLDDVAGRDRVELGPGARPGGGAVDRPDVRAAWAQRRQVDADAPAAGHDLGHDLEVVEDAGAAVLRRWDDVAVVVGHRVASAGAGQDPAARDELEVGERGVEAPRPHPALFGRAFDLGDALRDAPPHLFGVAFGRVAVAVLQAVPVEEHLLADSFELGALLARYGRRILWSAHRAGNSHGCSSSFRETDASAAVGRGRLAPARLILFEAEPELVPRLHQPALPLPEPFDLVDHGVDVLERAVDAREADVRDFVQLAQRRHHALTDKLRRNLGTPHAKQLRFDVGDGRLDRLGRDRPLEAGHADAAAELLPVVLLAPAVLLDDEEPEPLGALVRCEPLPAAQALAAPADGVVELARIHDLRPRLVGPADETAHCFLRCSGQPRHIRRRHTGAALETGVVVYRRLDVVVARQVYHYGLRSQGVRRHKVSSLARIWAS